MRSVDITGASLLGPQDFLWWATMMQNDHIMASAGASIVRLPQKSEYTVGTVVNVADDTLAIQKYGIYGVVVANLNGYSLVKILGPARVRWATKPTEVGMLAVMNGAGSCVAMHKKDVLDLRPVLGVALEVPSSNMGVIGIGNPGYGTQSQNSAACFGVYVARAKIACCVINLEGPSIDYSYPCIGVSGVSREAAGCGYGAGVPYSTISVYFTQNWFLPAPDYEPLVKASLENTALGMIVYDHTFQTGSSTMSHLMFRCKESVMPTTVSGKMHVYAVGNGA